jgi:glycosyltransferase involved in cell wall biosynthesis
MDVFCLPSYANEGVPQAILQAMLCALPIVTTPVGAILEAVSDGETALVVPPRDAAALAAAIGRLLDDPSACRAPWAPKRAVSPAPTFQRNPCSIAWKPLFRQAASIMSQPLDWTTVSDDPNNREAKAAVRAWLKAAQTVHTVN